MQGHAHILNPGSGGRQMKENQRPIPRLGRFSPALIPVVAVLLSFVVGAGLIVLAGASPLEAYRHLFLGAFGNWYNISEVLVRSGPLLLAALGIAFAFRCGAISIGAEGQILIGGLAAAIAGVVLKDLPSLVVVPATVLSGFLAGAVWGAIPGYLYARKGLSVVINTIMLNYVAYYLITYAVNGPFRDPAHGGIYPQSPMLTENAWLPVLFSGTRLHAGLLIAVAALVAFYLVIWKTTFGFRIRTIGANPGAAAYAGVNVGRTTILAMAISGGLAGLAGVGEIGGLHHRVMEGFSANYGWDAIAVALLGRLNPVGIGVFSVFWAALKVGASGMQRAVQVPTSLVFAIQAIATLFVIGSELYERRMRTARLSAEHAEREEGGATVSG